MPTFVAGDPVAALARLVAPVDAAATELGRAAQAAGYAQSQTSHEGSTRL